MAQVSNKLITIKEFIKVAIFFIIFYAIGSCEKSYDTKAETINTKTEQITKHNIESEHDSVLWNVWGRSFRDVE